MGIAEISISPSSPNNQRANPGLLGTGIEFTNHGDSLLLPDSLQFNPNTLNHAKVLQPTTVRFPGGVHADAYRWTAGLGLYEERQTSPSGFSSDRVKVAFGTQEMIRLCSELGAKPVIQANVISAEPSETLAWYEHFQLQNVQAHWELGNEPYLNSAPHLPNPSSQDFAKRWLDCAQTIRTHFLGATLGCPLRMDYSPESNIPAVHKLGYNVEVLTALRENRGYPGWFALHSAYWPDISGSLPEDSLIWYACMAGSSMVSRAIQEQKIQTKAHGFEFVPFAMTEWALLCPADLTLSRTMASALYAFDVVRVMQQEGIYSAQFWSLANNGSFGAISTNGVRRPAFWPLYWLRQLLVGEILPVSIQCDVHVLPNQVGRVPQNTNVSLVTALASMTGAKVRMIIANKSLTNPQRVYLAFPMNIARGIQYSLAPVGDPLNRADVESKYKISAKDIVAGQYVTLSPASVHYLDMWIR